MTRIRTNRPLLRLPGSSVGTAGPLAGVRLVAAGAGVATELAARHLWALGCQLGPRGELRAGEAGRLELGRLSCSIDWAGPVALPLRHETEVQAACGIAQLHGRRYGGPRPLGIDYASAVAAVLAVQGLLAARYALLRGSAVREVRTSVAEAALLTVSHYLSAATVSTAEDRAGDRAVVAAPAGGGAPPFTSRDGVRFEIEALGPGQWLAFWSRLGVADPVIGRGWPPFQLRFATARCRLPIELSLAAAELPYQQLAAVAAGAGLSIVPVRAGGPCGYPAPPWRIARAAEPWPQTVPSPRTGPVRPTGPALSTGLALSTDPALPTSPALPADPPGAPAPTRPLEGVVVVELTRRLSGPLSGRLLALLGAEVVRIEPPGGEPPRPLRSAAGELPARCHPLDHGKRVVQADPRSAEGRRTIRELVGGADVFLHNLAPREDTALGLDAERLLTEQPGLVHARVSAWGELFGDHPRSAATTWSRRTADWPHWSRRRATPSPRR